MMSLPLPEFEKPVKLLLVVADAEAHVENAVLMMDAHNIGFERLDMPSSAEIPTAIAIAARMSNFDGFVVLADAQTPESVQGLQMLGLQGLCIGYGLDSKDADKATSAVAAALHLVATSRKWGRPDNGVGFTSEILLAQGGKTTA